MPAPTDLPAFFTHIFPWPFVYVGGSLAWSATRELIRSAGSHHWPTVDGTVVCSKLEISATGGDDQVSVYTPLIEYRYLADGLPRTSRRVALADINPGGKAGAEAILKRYPVGQGVRIYLSPANPEIAILEPGMRWPMLGKLFGGLFFLTAGVAMLLAFDTLGFVKQVPLPQ